MATTKAYELGQLAKDLSVDSSGNITINADLDVDYAGFDSDFSSKSTTDLSEGNNLYHTNTRVDTRINLQTGSNLDLSSKSTADLSEGSNLYYTDARADARIAAADTGDLSEGSNLYYTDARADARIAAADTGDLSEGSNLYYTDARARGAVSLGTAGSQAYNSSTGAFTIPGTTDHITEGTNLFFTNARADARINLQTGSNLDLSSKSTSDLSEGSNLYYTNARADARIAAADTGDLSEGSNLYYTDARADARIAAADTGDLSEGSNLYYTDARADARIAAASTTDLSEGSNLYYTTARGDSDTGAYISGNRTYGNITTTGYIAGPATMTIDPAAVGDNTGTLVIAGDLQVDGTTTTINSTTVTVDDKNITLASGAANNGAANGAGITVDGSNATITYDGTNDEWDFNKDVNVTGTVTADGLTVDGSEGSVTFGTGSSVTIDTGAVGANPRLYFDHNNLTGGLYFIEADRGNQAMEFATSSKVRIGIASNGDISFYEDTGSTAKFFWDASAESLGIGDTSPLAPLFVNGNETNLTDLTAVLWARSKTGASIPQMNVQGDQWQFGGGGTLDTSPTMTIDYGSNAVGIGTSSPSAELHIEKSSADAAVRLVRTGYGYTELIGSTGGSGNDFKINLNGTDRFYIQNSSGNVGIGTTSPQQLLHIHNSSGDFSAEAVLTGRLSTGTPKAEVAFKRGTSGDGAMLVLRSSNSSGALIDAVTIKDGTGNVGIGTTGPSAKFHVENTAAGTGAYIENDFSWTAANLSEFSNSAFTIRPRTADVYLKTSGSAGDIRFQGINAANNASRDILFNPFGGNVGIGTSSPSRVLHTSGDIVRFDNAGPSAILLLDTTNNEGFRLVTNRTSGAFSIEDMGTATSGAGTERMVIDSSGKVGIGTSTPGSNHAKANNLVVGGGSAGGMAIFNGTSEGWYAFSRANANNTDSYDGGMSYDGDRNLKLHTNAGNTRMTIDGSGNVLVGGTSQINSSTLSVYGDQGISTTRTGSSSFIKMLVGSSGESRIDTANASRAMEIPSSGSEVVFNSAGVDRNFRVESDSNTHMLFVDAGGDHVNIGTSSDRGGVLNVYGTGTPIAVIESESDGTVLSLRSTDTDANHGPTLELYRNATGAASDNLGSIIVKGTDASAQDQVYFSIGTQISAAGNGVEASTVYFQNAVAGSLRERITMSSSALVINQEGLDNDFRVESDSNTHMLFVDAGANHVNIGGSADYGSVLNVFTTGTDALEIVSDNGNANAGPYLDITRKSGSPADGDLTGAIRFLANNSAAETIVGSISTRFDDVSNASEDSAMFFKIRQAGAQPNVLIFQPTETVVNEDSFDRDFRVESDNNANALFVRGSDGNVGIGTNSPEHKLHVKSTTHDEPIALFEADTGSGGDVSIRLEGGASGNADEIYIEFSDRADPTNSFTVGLDDDASKLFFGYGALGTSNGHTQMVLQSDGNVGIGTTSPGAKLTIKDGVAGALNFLEFHYDDPLGDLGFDGSEEILVNYKFTDSNANNTPQVQVAAELGNPGHTDGGTTSEGRGNYVVRTNDGATGGLSDSLRVEWDGSVHMPQQPAALYYNVTSNATVANGELIGFGTAAGWNRGITDSNSKTRFTVPAAGLYAVAYTVSGSVTTPSAGDGIRVLIKKNGATYANADGYNIETVGTVAGQEYSFRDMFLVDLGINHYIELQFDNVGPAVFNANYGNINIWKVA